MHGSSKHENMYGSVITSEGVGEVDASAAAARAYEPIRNSTQLRRPTGSESGTIRAGDSDFT